jgi:hypothetical protein
MMERVFGFQYPLNSDSDYKVGWIDNFDSAILESDFQKIHTNFPKINMLRIPIGWEDMNASLLISQMNTTIQIGQNYGFKFIFVLMDRISGWWDEEGPQPQKLLPDNWEDQEARIQNVVEPFKNNDGVYAWALGNELNVFQEVVREWFGHFLPFIRSIDFNTPITTSFYPLGLNSSTISHANELVNVGLDFIELHWYFTDTEDIQAFADEMCALCEAPILLSEFGTYNGLSTYSVDTNKRILNDTINHFENRPNVIGLNYYRWSDDNDPYTIWNTTSQTPRPEGEILNNSVTGFLQQYPYAYLEKIQSNQTSQQTIYDPSFQTVVEWPEPGWAKWNNHTAYDLASVPSANPQPGSWSEVSVQNLDFEISADWGSEPLGLESWAYETSLVYHGNRSLKMWAEGSADFQRQHYAITVEPKCSYILSGWINVTETNGGGYAFLSMAFRASNGTWIKWPESEYINMTHDWVNIHVTGVCPENAVDMRILCRVRGNGGNCTAYFDYLELWKIPHCSYDGRSYALAWGQCLGSSWNVAQISQNFTFANPAEDIRKIWSFSCKVATTQWDEYTTDWKGCYLTLAFTTQDSSEWITWLDSEYLSFNNDWTQLNVSGIPPPNAKGLQMIIKSSNSKRGVMFIDEAKLTSKPVIISKDCLMSELTREGQEYQMQVMFESIDGTVFNGSFYAGNLVIVDSNCTYFQETRFGDYFNDTTQIRAVFSFGISSGIWMPLFLVIGLIGVALVVVGLIYTICCVRKKNGVLLVLGVLMIVIGIVFIFIWLWR